MRATFLDAGHILESANGLLELEEGGRRHRVLFSGDLGSPLVGLVTAVLIVTVSPWHELRSDEDSDHFEREEKAVLLSVTVLWWMLGATVIGLAVAAYLR